MLVGLPGWISLDAEMTGGEQGIRILLKLPVAWSVLTEPCQLFVRGPIGMAPPLAPVDSMLALLFKPVLVRSGPRCPMLTVTLVAKSPMLTLSTLFDALDRSSGGFLEGDDASTAKLPLPPVMLLGLDPLICGS